MISRFNSCRSLVVSVTLLWLALGCAKGTNSTQDAVKDSTKTDSVVTLDSVTPPDLLTDGSDDVAPPDDTVSTDALSDAESPKDVPVLTDGTADQPSQKTCNSPTVAWINEIHYADDQSPDENEGLEIAGIAGTSLAGWQVVSYKSSGAPLQTVSLDTLIGDNKIPSQIPDQDSSGFGAVWIDLSVVNGNEGLRNGPNSGVALIDAQGNVVQFLAWEGDVIVPEAGSPAYGCLPIDIGVSESDSSTKSSESLQFVNVTLNNSGKLNQGALSGDWTGPLPGTPGQLNVNQFDTTPPSDTVTPDGSDLLIPDAQQTPGNVWINELHYDNGPSGDSDEGVEIAGAAGENLARYKLLFFNGNPTQLNVYKTVNLSGTLPDECKGFGAIWFPVTGIENGNPDGVALVFMVPNSDQEIVVQFISYGGQFQVTIGNPPNNETSTDIGVTESNSTLVGQTIQLVGTPGSYSWVANQPHTHGAINTGQTYPGGSCTVTEDVVDAGGDLEQPDAIEDTGADVVADTESDTEPTDGTLPDDSDDAAVENDLADDTGTSDVVDDSTSDVDEDTTSDVGDDATSDTGTSDAQDDTDSGTPGPPTVWINEFHYDNSSTDVNEGVEIAGIAGTDLSAYKIVLYDGSNGATYDEFALSGVLGNDCNGYGTLWFDRAPIQNGFDGIALVKIGLPDEVIEFISYEGAFVATNGPAVGLTSVNVGVAEGSGSVTASIQRTGEIGSFSWEFTENSRGVPNANQTFVGVACPPIVGGDDATDGGSDVADDTSDVADDTSDVTDDTSDVTDDTSDTTSDVVDDTSDVSDDATSDVADDTSDVADDTSDTTDDATSDVVDDTGDVSDDATSDVADDTSDTTDDATSDVVDDASDAVSPLTTSQLVAGDLVITEMTIDPQNNPSTDPCEWFEIYNASGQPIDLQGLVITDDDAGQGTISTSVIVPAGTYAVLGKGDAASWTANCDTQGASLLAAVQPVAYYGSTPAFANGGDPLQIRRPDLTEIDGIPYLGGTADCWNLKQGVLDSVQNDVPANWCACSNVFLDNGGGLVDKGTPNAENSTCN